MVLAVMTAAAPAMACRIPRGQPPASEAELKRRADGGLVRVADSIVIAEVSEVRIEAPGAVYPSFNPVSPVQGTWPIEIDPRWHISMCDVVGNLGTYPNIAVGDRVLLFVVDRTVFHAEPIGSARAGDLIAIITQGNQ